MNPIHIMEIGGISLVGSIFLLLINFFAGPIMSVRKVVLHVLIGFIAWISGGTFFVGLIMYLINYAKR